jgi:hypothetical protein
MHQGAVIDSIATEADMPPHYGRLWEQLPAFMVRPVMASHDEDFEETFGPWQLVCGTSTVIESFWGSIVDCYAPVRYFGQLCVRDPVNMMYSYSSESVISHGTTPCPNDTRAPAWFNGANFYGRSYARVSSELIALVGEIVVLPVDQFRFHPIRAV